MPNLRRIEFWDRAVVVGMRRAGRGMVTAAIVLGGAACTDPYRLPPPPSEADRAGFGQAVLAVPGAVVPENEIPVGQAEDEAGAAIGGAAAGGAYGAASMAIYGAPMVLGAVIFPPAAIVGVMVAAGAAGGVAGMSARAEVLVPENIKQEIDALVLTEWAEFEAASGAQRHLATAAASVTGRPAANTPLLVAEAAGTDNVLAVEITHLGFTGRGGRDPVLRLVVSIEATLVDAGGEALHTMKLTYVGPPYNFSHGRADDGRALHGDFSRAFDAIGERVYEELFLLWLPQPAT